MVFRPPALGLCLWALMAERPVALPRMSTVDEYHKLARDCLRWAARARTEDQRKRLLNLAHDWTQAASGLEGASPVVPGEQSPPG